METVFVSEYDIMNSEGTNDLSTHRRTYNAKEYDEGLPMKAENGKLNQTANKQKKAKPKAKAKEGRTTLLATGQTLRGNEQHHHIQTRQSRSEESKN